MESQKSAALLPKLFRWIFTILEVLAGLVAIAVVVCMVVDPTLPPGAHFGPINGEVLGQAATMTLQPAPGGTGSVFTVTAFNGILTLSVNEPAGLIALLEEYGLPLLLVHAMFFVALFDILRRLFRNVGRGESFTPQSVRLVQWVGGSLIVFAIVSSFAEVWFHHAIFTYMMAHTQVAVGGAPLQLPAHAGEHHLPFWFGHGGVFLGHPVFWCGLLVLALAEVFRQGLALKRDAELTV